MADVITNNLDIWSLVQINKSTAGRGSNGKQEAYGIKKLRELILDLAVRGKLVAQNPDDEPASVLLEKVTEEKNRLIVEKKIKNTRKFPEITNSDKPFEIPNRWKWVRINDVGRDWGQKTPEDNFTYIDVSAIDNVAGIVKVQNILSASDAPSRARKIVKEGTVIYSTVRPYLQNICVIQQDYVPEPIASTAFAVLHPLQEMPGKFFALYLRSPEFVKYVESVQTGIAYPAINDKQFYGGLVPLPPLDEQHRILAKVDELMALCDQLEQQQTDSIAAHQTLFETLLGTLTTTDSQQDFEETWNRIANHFDTLFTTEHSIDQLKQTILQLAIMGKLVPQEHNDEPASALLERIAGEKERLTKEGKIRKQKSLLEVDAEEKLFDLPIGWEWCRLRDIVYLLGDGLHGTPEYTPNEKYFFVNGNNLKDGQIVIKPETKTVAQDQYDKYKKDLGENTVLVSINGTLGNVAFYNNEEIVLGKSACYFNLSEDIYKGYIKVIIESPGFLDYAFKNATGSTIKNLGLKAMNSLAIALPPKDEQHRIVSKVDDLMALCDALKTRLNDAQTTQIHLANAIVEQAVA